MITVNRIRVGVAAALATAAALVAAPSAQAAVGAAAPAAEVAPAALAGPLAVAQGTRLASFDKQLIGLINDARAKNGRAPLQEATGLTSLSVWWSTKMDGGSTSYQLAHNPNAWTMVTSYGASNRTSWGENVAWSSSTGTSAQEIFTAYMNSPGHRANILSAAYHYVGVGTVGGTRGLWNTTEFTDKVQAGQAVGGSTTPATTPVPPTGSTITVRDSVTGSVLKPSVVMLRDGTCVKPLKLIYSDATGMLPVPALKTGTYCMQVRGVPAGYTLPKNKLIAVHAGRVFAARIMAAAKPMSGTLTVRGSGTTAAVGASTFMLRDRSCVRPLRLLYTDAKGMAPLTNLTPAVYCLTGVRVPAGYKVPSPAKFLVPLNASFTATVTLPRA
ncbi:CAP domain-containing protein [Nakamurella endophytica]|uniref:SCP domain-containing protein n=1 Tax=Nakamurella endophytica TaxID=1748367 RepID=A0A917WGL9_9ACTN|nr:CAP domain-containing protein [Nakamurella endophytica]GGM01565.1 hypothetical protein GCM10011594_22040 [Nakamurella endophytica]